MPVQDDERERQLLQLFNLHVPPDRSRADIDAYLKMGDELIPFELKSTTSGSVSTVRDFGPDHIIKWKDQHWIFGVYSPGGAELLYCLYASPADMAPWIRDKENYVRPDAILEHSASRLVTHGVLAEILGVKDSYTLDEAKWIMKRQWSAKQYKEAQDLPGGLYSPDRMLGILQARCAYVIRRGATLNNPHIEKSYFDGWPRIVEDHAATLRQMVSDYLASKAAPTDEATA
ncbi:hypothetical protein ACXC9Q_18670 [Kribbella sp. CWNU-51]